MAIRLAIYGAKRGRIRQHGPDVAPHLTCDNVIPQHPTDRSDGPTDQKVGVAGITATADALEAASADLGWTTERIRDTATFRRLIVRSPADVRWEDRRRGRYLTGDS